MYILLKFNVSLSTVTHIHVFHKCLSTLDDSLDMGQIVMLMRQYLTECFQQSFETKVTLIIGCFD